jgi:CheY-like chemotaxis protein
MPHVTILCADDNQVLRLALKDMFELQGWCVEPCEDGLSALRKIEGSAHYALLLLGNQLPGANGLELTRRARALAHRRHTPIVIFSASEIGTEARSAGANAFLKKPDDLGKVIETVSRMLDQNKFGGGERAAAPAV